MWGHKTRQNVGYDEIIRINESNAGIIDSHKMGERYMYGAFTLCKLRKKCKYHQNILLTTIKKIGIKKKIKTVINTKIKIIKNPI